MANKNLVKLAKGGDKKVAVPQKPVEKVEEKLTPAEERDLKAKQKVKELLEDVPMTSPKQEEEKEVLIELDESKDTAWLSEQVNALIAENELLKGELLVAKNDYKKVFEESQKIRSGAGLTDDSALKASVVKLFNELQVNYMKSPGMSPVYPGIPNFTIHPVAFMERMVMFFPFLASEKRYRV